MLIRMATYAFVTDNLTMKRKKCDKSISPVNSVSMLFVR